MCWNQLLLAGLSTGSVYFLTVPSDHTVAVLTQHVVKMYRLWTVGRLRSMGSTI